MSALLHPSFRLVEIHLDEVRDLCERFHGYGSAGAAAVYSFGVAEGSALVAAFSWQPPPPGAAKSVCPEAPQGVLALSRMVAVPKIDRHLKHISKPLRYQMKHRIDRTRWPVLLTYSDEGQGHNGFVYECSGWEKTTKALRPFYVDANGKRASSYSNGKHGGRELVRGGTTTIQRWEHWACERGAAAHWMHAHDWRRIPVKGKVWRSGNVAFTYGKLA
jgi:hypothetical protein